jgi:hypothetical protein
MLDKAHKHKHLQVKASILILNDVKISSLALTCVHLDYKTQLTSSFLPIGPKQENTDP